jgi:hypothetical protein
MQSNLVVGIRSRSIVLDRPERRRVELDAPLAEVLRRHDHDHRRGG